MFCSTAQHSKASQTIDFLRDQINIYGTAKQIMAPGQRMRDSLQTVGCLKATLGKRNHCPVLLKYNVNYGFSVDIFSLICHIAIELPLFPQLKENLSIHFYNWTGAPQSGTFVVVVHYFRHGRRLRVYVCV